MTLCKINFAINNPKPANFVFPINEKPAPWSINTEQLTALKKKIKVDVIFWKEWFILEMWQQRADPMKCEEMSWEKTDHKVT